VVTPDHWHALVAIAAMEAGLDVYCEKPLTLTIAEGQAMVSAARRYGTVFQTGSQQRSGDQFLQACELVRNGKIGRLIKVDTHIGGIGPGKWEPVQTPPDELNWDFWLGPAPYRDYRAGHVHYQFRWFQDFSGGKMTDWGAHHNDIAQWGIGADGSGPVSVEPRKFKFHESGPYDVAGDFEVHYRYANGVELTCHSNGKNGIKFTGEDGWIFVNRGGIEASDPAILEIELGPNDVRLYKSDNHHLNWLDCIATRERCICGVEIGHRSVTVCHLGNIAMRLGRPLEWDPETEKFVGDEAANQLLSKPMRAPWHL
jgi:predicted dehydrogenase